MTTLVTLHPHSFNREEYSSFARKNITRDDAEARIDLLYEMQQKVQSDGELSPRTQREFDEREIEQLEAVLYPDEPILQTRVKIQRAIAGQFYFIKFTESQEEIRFKKFSDSRALVNAVGQFAVSELGILQSLVNPSSDMTLYQAGTLSQLKAILQTDFLDAMRHGYVADLNLLSAARSLYKIPDVYGNILKLHAQSLNLYTQQSSFNRACQQAILNHSKITQQSATNICALIERCGPKLEKVPEDFQEQYCEIMKKEYFHSMALYETIAKESAQFRLELKALKDGISTECLQVVSKKQGGVANIMRDIDDLQQKQNELLEKEKGVQEKYNAFQKVKAKEHESKKVVEESGVFWIFSWRSTRMTETDFGSRGLWEEYQNVKRASRNLQEQMESKRKELEDNLKKIDHMSSCSPVDLEQAARSLSAAVIAVRSLEVAISKKEAQANSQVSTIQQEIAAQEGQTNSVFDAMDSLSEYKDKVLNAHAIWLQTEQQCTTMRQICNEEAKIVTLVQQDIEEEKENGKMLIQERLTAFGSQQEENALGVFILPTPTLLLQDRPVS